MAAGRERTPPTAAEAAAERHAGEAMTMTTTVEADAIAEKATIVRSAESAVVVAAATAVAATGLMTTVEAAVIEATMTIVRAADARQSKIRV